MPQLAKKSLTPVKICRARFTRLTATGAVAAGPNNSYVTDVLTEVGISPQIAEGDAIEVTSGCGVLLVSYKQDDQLQRYDISMSIGRVDAALKELLLGHPVILDTSTVPVPIGNHNPVRTTGSFVAPAVAAEYWQEAIDYDHRDADKAYFHWVFPMVKFREDDFDMTNDATVIPVAGSTVENTLWGVGPYAGDPAPEAVHANGAYWLTNTIPTAAVGYGTAA